MAVPFIDLRRFESDFLDRWAEISANVAKNTMFVGGPEANRLEERLKERSGAAAVVGCANGTDAIQLALRAVGVGKDDVVLIPDATFWATFEAVVNVNALPVTVDIDMTDLQMDYDSFVSACEKFKPKAAILVHLYGWGSARVKDFRAYCQDKGIVLIEDGAQCFDVKFEGEPLYQGAHIATTSFYPAKVLGSCGDAGAVYCSTAELSDTVRRLGNHGRSSHYGHSDIGWNSRMGGYDAAFLNLCLDYIDARIASRIAMAKRYVEFYKELGVCHVGPPAGYEENGYLTVALVEREKRDAVQGVLKEKGIGFANVYPGAMSKQPGAAAHIHGQIGGEKSDLLSNTVINLPLYAYMTDAEFTEVKSAFTEALRTAGITINA